MPKRLAAAIVLAALPCAALAEVTAHGPQGFVIRLERTAAADAARVWHALADVGQWWSGEHSYSGEAGNLTLEPRAGGCFCERWDGGTIEHMRVAFASPAMRRMVLTGGLGPLLWMGATGSLAIRLEPADGAGTRIAWEYRVTGFEPAGWEKTAGLVDEVLAEQLERLSRFATAGG